MKIISHIVIFKNTAFNLSLRPEPIITRWGSWVKTTVYYYEIHKLLKSIVNFFNKEEEIIITKVFGGPQSSGKFSIYKI